MNDEHPRVVSAAVVAVPVRRLIGIGAIAGFVPGFVLGCLFGGLVAWGASAAVNWMQQVSFTTGMQVALMPFGNRVSMLQSIHDNWFIVVPVVGVGMGLLTATIGALTAAIVAAVLPGGSRRARVLLRIEDVEQADPE